MLSEAAYRAKRGGISSKARRHIEQSDAAYRAKRCGISSKAMRHIEQSLAAYRVANHNNKVDRPHHRA